MFVRSVRQAIDRTLLAIEKVILAVDITILCFLAVIVVVQVVARYLMVAMTGTEELARFSYIWFVFLAWPIAALHGSDVRVTSVFDRFSASVRKVLLGIFHVIMALFDGVILKSAIINVGTHAVTRAAANEWIMMSWIYMVIAAAVALTGVFNLVRAVRLWTGIDIYQTQEELDRQMIEAAIRGSVETQPLDDGEKV